MKYLKKKRKHVFLVKFKTWIPVSPDTDLFLKIFLMRGQSKHNLAFLFPWVWRGFNYEDDQLTVLDLWLNSQPSIKFVGRKASLRPTFCQLDGEGGSEMESEDRQVDAWSPSSSSPSSPPYSNDSRSQAETAFEVLVLLQHLAVHRL